MNVKIKLIIFSIFLVGITYGQSQDDLKSFMETYEKLKIDQEANEIVKESIESEKDPEERPVKLLVSPSDISKYYREKMSSIKKEISILNNVFNYTDSIPPIQSFGYNFFFKKDSINFIDNIKVNNDYILGYGDEIIISVWGEVQQYEKKIIQRDGTVYIDNVGLLYLGGKNILKAKDYVYNRFSKVYSTLNAKPPLSFIDLSLASLKNINISISGFVNIPGNYVVNPATNLLNLLILAGGISENGSLRNIYIKRNKTLIDSIDFYPIISGLDHLDFSGFQDNDAIIVPPKGGVVALTGAIRSPAFYEIKNDKVADVLKYAGGLTRKAQQLVFLYGNNNENKLLTNNLFGETVLESGDSLVIPIKNIISKNVKLSIQGNGIVDIPWVKNLSYDDIFQMLNLDINNIKKIELVRRINNYELESFILENYDGGSFVFLPNDFITIQLLRSHEKVNTVTIKGNVGSPGIYPINGNRITLNSILERSGGILANSTLNDVVVKRDTSKFGSFEGNLIIAPNDTIIVNHFNGIVSVSGEVHNPGNIEWMSNRSAKDYISLSGGLNAYGDEKHITYITPFGEAMRIKKGSRIKIIPGSRIVISKKPENNTNQNYVIFQQISSIITSIVTLSILANSTAN